MRIAILSHDLLEGIFARAGLASDIEVVEEFPSRYAVAAARQHRWVRGDWQLLPWIFGFRRKARDGSRKTPLPLMGRWKLLDNLRRSLSAPAALLAMLIGWLLPMTAAAIWTAYILLTIALPPLLPALSGIVPLRAGVSLRNHLRTLRGDFALGLLQSAFLVTFLAHQAWVMVDAVVRTLFRLFIRRRHLLEWVTAAQTTDELPVRPPRARLCRSRQVWAPPACRGPVLFLGAAKLADRGAARVFVGAVAARRALGEPAAACGRSLVGHAGGCLGAQAGRAAHLALLRKIRHRGRQHAPAR